MRLHSATRCNICTQRVDRSQSNWYRDQYHLEALILDGEDYASNGNAPLLFNVIDTSNLLDHFGAINILVAASPLLENSISATLYTGALVKKQEDLKALVAPRYSSIVFCSLLATILVGNGKIYSPLCNWLSDVTTSGSRCDDGFRVNVSEDVHSWNGHSSSLIVSFVAPS